ncbi:MAG: glycosyltransferase family 2 protein [Burkholderiales bacterium]|nr:glycosyltransferase family 2 protein [Burkholderiales bacterium]MBH2016231.1 glycosyltransferase family 2 protein [Burkholderiales bacterium]
MSAADQAIALIALACWGLVIYSYALYPLVLAAWAALHQLRSDVRHVLAKGERRVQEPADWPHVAVVIAAYNEEVHIAQRVHNILQQDYPRDRLRLYIGSDGSRDRTADILRTFEDERLSLHLFDVNRGKATVLNDLRDRVTEPLVVFSDANTFFHPQAIQQLVRWFDDPNVGGVTGELRLRSSKGDNQDSLYWRMEQVLKFLEGRIGGLLGANGAIYAVRRSLWPALRPNEICDDFCIGMNVPACGARMVYDPSAWAEEDTPDDIREEYHRRLRIGVGNFLALFGHPEFFSRTSNATRFAYFSHKVLRWVTPHLLLLALLLSLWLATRSEGWSTWSGLQLLGYAVVAACHRRSASGRPVPGPLRLPTFFFSLNWAFLIASWRYLRGSQQGTWRRTAR